MSGRIGAALLRLAGVVTRCALAISVVIGLCCLGALVLEHEAGYTGSVILSGSMRTTMPVGTLVVSGPVPAASVRVGDVITFHPPGAAYTVTHRVHAIQTVAGERLITTKGDANPAPDPWRVVATGSLVEMRFHLPQVGYLAVALQTPMVRFCLVVVPVLLFGTLLLIELWSDETENDDAPVPGGVRALPA